MFDAETKHSPGQITDLGFPVIRPVVGTLGAVSSVSGSPVFKAFIAENMLTWQHYRVGGHAFAIHTNTVGVPVVRIHVNAIIHACTTHLSNVFEACWLHEERRFSIRTKELRSFMLKSSFII